MSCAKLRHRAEANIWSKSALASLGTADTLQYKSSTNINYLAIEYKIFRSPSIFSSKEHIPTNQLWVAQQIQMRCLVFVLAIDASALGNAGQRKEMCFMLYKLPVNR